MRHKSSFRKVSATAHVALYALPDYTLGYTATLGDGVDGRLWLEQSSTASATHLPAEWQVSIFHPPLLNPTTSVYDEITLVRVYEAA